MIDSIKLNVEVANRLTYKHMQIILLILCGILRGLENPDLSQDRGKSRVTAPNQTEVAQQKGKNLERSGPNSYEMRCCTNTLPKPTL